MKKGYKDLQGQKFGQLLVLGKMESKKTPSGQYKAMWLCRCECGKEKIITAQNLKNGHTKSCGCCNAEMCNSKKVNRYDLSGKYGIGYTSNTNKQFYFDLEDYDKIKDYCWYEDFFGYVVNIYKRKNLKLHKLITGTNKTQIIDHINRNKLDNRKANLRVCSIQENSFNAGLSKNNTSGYNGVFWNSDKKKWCARIGVNKKEIFLGYFNNKKEAHQKRIDAEKLYYGEFAPKRSDL